MVCKLQRIITSASGPRKTTPLRGVVNSEIVYSKELILKLRIMASTVAQGGTTTKGFGGTGGQVTDQQMDELIRNEDASFDHNQKAITKE